MNIYILILYYPAYSLRLGMMSAEMDRLRRLSAASAPPPPTARPTDRPTERPPARPTDRPAGRIYIYIYI